MTEQTKRQIKLSSRKRRLAAFLIDHTIASTIIILFTFIALGPNFMESEVMKDKMLNIILFTTIPIIIFYCFKDSYKGISLGKWIMGIIVKNNIDYNTPILKNLVLRNVSYIILPIEMIVLAFNKDKKRIGDMLAGTKVVTNPNKPKMYLRIIAFITIGIISILFMFFTTAASMKGSAAYKVAIENIEINDDIIEQTGGIIGYGYMPLGNISIRNGHGNAGLQIKVLGKKSDTTAIVFLYKEPNGEWTIRAIK